MLIDAILRLHEKVMAEPLGEKRRKIVEAREKAVVPPGAMPSSYRHDKVLRAEWEKAAAQGREEQLRIEKWMEERARLSGSLPRRNGGTR
jgi:NADH-quinone oxidoreductase subunit B